MRGTAGPNWESTWHRFGLFSGCLYCLCSSISSCLYVFCCCWLMEDRILGGRSYNHFGTDNLPPPPPRPEPIGPGPSGVLLGSHHHFGPYDMPPPPPPPRPAGPWLYEQQPSPPGYPGELPPRF